MKQLPLRSVILLVIPLVAGCLVSFSKEDLNTDAGVENTGSDASAVTVRRDSMVALDVLSRDQRPSCPEVCANDCADGVCRLPCAEGCTCPAGQHCEIRCDSDSCTGPIDCTQGLGCDIRCGAGACSDEILCGPGTCDVSCLWGSCRDLIECSGSSSCCVRCGLASCADVRCPDRCDGRCHTWLLASGCDC